MCEDTACCCIQVESKVAISWIASGVKERLKIGIRFNDLNACPVDTVLINPLNNCDYRQIWLDRCELNVAATVCVDHALKHLVCSLVWPDEVHRMCNWGWKPYGASWRHRWAKNMHEIVKIVGDQRH